MLGVVQKLVTCHKSVAAQGPVFGVETLEMLLLLSSSRLYDTFIISTDELDWN